MEERSECNVCRGWIRREMVWCGGGLMVGITPAPRMQIETTRGPGGEHAIVIYGEQQADKAAPFI